MPLDKENVAYQARLNAAACTFGLQQIQATQYRLLKDYDPIESGSITRTFGTLHELAQAAINAIVCFSECCLVAECAHVAKAFESIRIDFKGFGFDYSFQDLEYKEEGEALSDADLRSLRDMLTKKLCQYELILTTMRDKYLHAAERLQRL